MVIVGICGAIGSGKSTLAAELCAADPEHSLHLETSAVIVDVANNFNAAFKEYIRHAINDDKITAVNHACRSLAPAISRLAARTITAEQLAVTADDINRSPVWYDKLLVYLDAVEEQPDILANRIDARNKQAYRPLLQWLGGYIPYKLDDQLLWYEELLRRVRDAGPEITLAALTAPRQPAEADFVRQAGGVIIKVVRPDVGLDYSEVTERLVSEIDEDITVSNDGTREQLAVLAGNLYHDLLRGRIRADYYAQAEAL